METAATPASAATSGLVPYCQMTASKSSSVDGRAMSAGPTAVAQRRATPSASREMPMEKRGIDEVPRHGALEGERAEGHHARAGAPDRVVARDGRQCGGGLVRGDELCRAPADQRQAGAVEEHGRAAVELQRVGPVVERHAAGVERSLAAHGVPARVATTSWLRPPARGRMPTAEKPASTSIRRRTAAGGR